MTAQNILVIKLGALGDLVYAMGPMRAIRRHHPDARITALTRAPYHDFLERSGLFDEVWRDPAPRLWQPGALLAWRRRLRAAAFDRVYDLQTSDRSALYFHLMGPGTRPFWSGVVAGASHRQSEARANDRHTVERQRDQLALAGIDEVPLVDLADMAGEIAAFDLPDRFALLAPGSSPGSDDKRWPAAAYADLAHRLMAREVTPVVIGGLEERSLAGRVLAGLPAGRDLTGQTALVDLPGLAMRAQCAIGNDTGPMHVLAAAGCPVTMLFSRAEALVKNRPLGPRAEVLFAADLATVDGARVWANVTAALSTDAGLR
ncbi:MAG: glycosyltransferase family 9 protein [Pseudomonadota bacterium]|nr:glycosyltransferase family 9 protein [Pseudomonadota bacterium]